MRPRQRNKTNQKFGRKPLSLHPAACGLGLKRGGRGACDVAACGWFARPVLFVADVRDPDGNELYFNYPNPPDAAAPAG